jgi:translation elongation factor EF-G
MKRKLLSIKS